MTAEQTLLIDSLSVAVAGKRKMLELQVDWLSFLRLANSHNLAALVCHGLQQDPDVWKQVPKGVRACLTDAYMQAIYWDSQQDYMKQLLQEKLSDADIPHIFLKGICLKQDYPVPALRTMCDLDVLVYASDFDEIDKVAAALDGKAADGDGNHRNYVFPGNVKVEFHPNLLHHATPVGTEINPGWQYAMDMPGDMSKQLTAEGFYLNTICHFADHFIAGDLSVRFVLDVWVNRNLRKPEADRAFVEQELDRFGLLDFAKNVEELAEVWFGNGQDTPLLQEFGEYILTNVHGISNRAMLNAISLAPGSNRFSALMKKAFYPKEELEDRYPWCKGKMLLLPAAWCARAYNAVTKHGSVIANWSKGTGQITKAEVLENQELLRRFGIFRKSKGKRRKHSF